MRRYRISADIGGTFTDVVAIDLEDRAMTTTKVSSRPAQPADSVLEGLQRLTSDPRDVEFLVHGQTVGLNAFLERKGARVLLLMTGGVRDGYTIARHHRRDLYALHYAKPELLVPRRDTMEVTERLRADGSVDTPLDIASLDPIVERIEQEGIEAVAVCLLHAYLNPVHELGVREALQRRCPQLSVTLSHEVAREWREYERASSAALNAYVAPAVDRYLRRLEDELTATGVTAPVHVMQSNGGISSARQAREKPVQTLLSGPVGGTIGGAAVGQATGRRNLLCVDMGGTSFDMSLIVDGRPSVSTETELEGLPLLMPLIDIHTIGAGGGSIAWLEAGGLRVGPQSAGAQPGPACYGRGGTEPTVTDANLWLGRLDPGHFLGGRMPLDADAAGAALRSLGGQIELQETALAEGILAIVNASMADAMRTITVRQGIDPREFTLVAFGGAGPMHAIAVAAELDMHEVIIPWSPGTFSAWGMLQTDIRQDFARSFFRPFEQVVAADVEATLKELEQEGSALLRDEGVVAADIAVLRSADVRYVGQEYTVNVVLPADLDLETLADRFHDAHRTRYGHATQEAALEFVNLRCAVIGQLDRPEIRHDVDEREGGALLGHRQVVFDGRPYDAPVLLRTALAVGERHAGPLIVEEDSATAVVPPGWSVHVDEHRNLFITSDQSSTTRTERP
jgi:N-methylhydantoinase A